MKQCDSCQHLREMDIKRALAERTISRRKFNSLSKQITNSLEENKPFELVRSIFEELKVARNVLTEKHDDYMILKLTEELPGEESTSDTDDYLDTPDNEFRDLEKALYDLGIKNKKKN